MAREQLVVGVIGAHQRDGGDGLVLHPAGPVFEGLPQLLLGNQNAHSLDALLRAAIGDGGCQTVELAPAERGDYRHGQNRSDDQNPGYLTPGVFVHSRQLLRSL